jgi:hypothetical protein
MLALHLIEIYFLFIFISCSGMGDSSSGSPEGLDFVVVPSSAGGNSSFELHSQSTEERATLGRYHHFRGHSGMCG